MHIVVHLSLLPTYSVPEKVRSLKVFSISSTQLRIAWLAPQSGTAGSYEVKVDTAEGNVRFENTTNTSIIIACAVQNLGVVGVKNWHGHGRAGRTVSYGLVCDCL